MEIERKKRLLKAMIRNPLISGEARAPLHQEGHSGN
jgi:hypothetical protein